MIKPGFLNYIHTFRGMAIVGILAIHCRLVFGWQNTLSEEFTKAIFDNSTILFVFISGFLFEHLKDRFVYSVYLKRKTKYVILPYILVSLPALYDKIAIENHGRDYIHDIIYYLLTGKHFGPFWFIPMIAIFYVISPLLLKVNRNYFYQFIFPLVFLGGLFCYRFGYYSNTVDSFLYFLPIYLMGMMASKYKGYLLLQGWKLIIPGALLYLGLFYLEVIGFFPAPRLDSFVSAQELPWLSLNLVKLKVCILCFVLLNFLFLIRRKRIGVFDALGDYSFGIYFIHLYLIIVMQRVVSRLNPHFEFTWLSFCVFLAINVLLSMAVVFAIKKIFRQHSRMIIGS